MLVGAKYPSDECGRYVVCRFGGPRARTLASSSFRVGPTESEPDTRDSWPTDGVRRWSRRHSGDSGLQKERQQPDRAGDERDSAGDTVPWGQRQSSNGTFDNAMGDHRQRQEDGHQQHSVIPGAGVVT
jgi:hypothetical protein